MDVDRKPRLFRAIVVMGAAITAPGCDEEDCCTPKRDAAASDTVATTDAPRNDAGTDAPEPPEDADTDAVLIL